MYKVGDIVEIDERKLFNGMTNQMTNQIGLVLSLPDDNIIDGPYVYVFEGFDRGRVRKIDVNCVLVLVGLDRKWFGKTLVKNLMKET